MNPTIRVVFNFTGQESYVGKTNRRLQKKLLNINCIKYRKWVRNSTSIQRQEQSGRRFRKEKIPSDEETGFTRYFSFRKEKKYTAKKMSYQNIYELEINIFSKRKWSVVDKVNRAMKLIQGQCTTALHHTIRLLHNYKIHKDNTEWLLLRITDANSGINRKQKNMTP